MSYNRVQFEGTRQRVSRRLILTPGESSPLPISYSFFTSSLGNLIVIIIYRLLIMVWVGTTLQRESYQSTTMIILNFEYKIYPCCGYFKVFFLSYLSINEQFGCESDFYLLPKEMKNERKSCFFFVPVSWTTSAASGHCPHKSHGLKPRRILRNPETER